MTILQNLKKSWHPSTMKNQERVWKAEQQKAEEDRKMAELQRELKEEREREVLKRTAEESGAIAKKGEEKLDWMYKVSVLHNGYLYWVLHKQLLIKHITRQKGGFYGWTA